MAKNSMKDIKMDKGSNTILLFTEQRAAFDYLSDEDAGKMIKPSMHMQTRVLSQTLKVP